MSGEKAVLLCNLDVMPTTRRFPVAGTRDGLCSWVVFEFRIGCTFYSFASLKKIVSNI